MERQTFKMRKNKCLILTCIVWMVSQAFMSYGQTGEPPAVVPPQNTEQNQSPNILIGAGDLLSVVVFDTPELSTSARVTQDGEVNLPVLGRLHLAGMTTIDAARKIELELRTRRLLLEPHVTVLISEYATQGATVMGEVRTPGVYPTLGTRRLLDMISVAGGLQPTAGKTISIIHRDDPQHPENIALQSQPGKLSAQQNPSRRHDHRRQSWSRVCHRRCAKAWRISD
jgi:polysaccharide export outer membrane protein